MLARSSASMAVAMTGVAMAGTLYPLPPAFAALTH